MNAAAITEFVPVGFIDRYFKRFVFGFHCCPLLAEFFDHRRPELQSSIRSEQVHLAQTLLTCDYSIPNGDSLLGTKQKGTISGEKVLTRSVLAGLLFLHSKS